MNRLEIRLLGGFGVVLAGRPVTGFESATARALLARLAAAPDAVLARPFLAELLWPGRQEGAALGNLRHTLSVVRKAIGDGETDAPVIHSSPSGLTIDRRSDVWIDVADLERLAATSVATAGAVQAWQTAIDLRRGPFLDGFEADLSEEWETWVLTTRASVDRTAAALHRRLADIRCRTGERDRAIEHLRAVLHLDPYDEDAVRRLLGLLAESGRQGPAVAEGDRFAERLIAELGVEPDRETTALIDDLRHGRLAPSRKGDEDPGGPIAGGLAGPDPMVARCVGREKELAELGARLEDAAAGAGGVMFVKGQAGSGKTVLLNAFASLAQVEMGRLAVAEGGCNAYGGPGDPYLPFRQILGTLAGDLDQATSKARPTATANLVARVPDVAEAILDEGPHLLGSLIDVEAFSRRFDLRFPDHPTGDRLREVAGVPSVPDAARRQQPLLEQYLRVVTRLARDRPLLITIDDLQWADVGTLDLLLHLARRLPGTSVLVVAGYRPGDVVAEGHAGQSVELVVSESRAVSHRDCVLELIGTRDFVDALVDAEPNLLDEGFRRRLYETTHGHALFTAEILAAMRERGDLLVDERGRWLAAPTLDWAAEPPRVEASIGARLSRLPADLARDLEVASVQGGSFVVDRVATVRGVDEAEVHSRLDTLGSPPHALVEPDRVVSLGGNPVSRYRFRHGLFAGHLYTHLSPADRRAIHEATGRAILAELDGGSPDEQAAELAVHFDRAGLIDDAIRYRELAGRRAMTLSANADAAAHLERALELLGTVVPSGDRDRRELGLLTALGACLQAQFGYTAPAAAQVYRRIRALTETVGPTLESAQAVGAVLTIDLLQARYAEALAGADRLAATANELGFPPIVAMAEAQAGLVLLMTGRFQEADERLRRADHLYDRDRDGWLTFALGQDVLVTALAWRSVVLWHLGLADKARQTATAAIEEARRSGHPFSLAFALGVAGCTLSELLEDADTVERAAAEMAAIAEREDLEFYRAAALLHRGSALAIRGRYARGLDGIDRGLAGWAELGTTAFATWIATFRIEHMMRAGRYEEAEQALDEIEALVARGQEAVSELRLPLLRGLLLQHDGDLPAAQTQLEEAVELARRSHAGGPLLHAATVLAELLVETGRPAAAHRTLRAAMEDRHEGHDTVAWRAAEAALERIAGTDG